MIVEGFGRRRYKADFIKFLIYSLAECDETLVHLDVLHDTKSLVNDDQYENLKNDYTSLSKRINKFTIWVEDKYVWKRRKDS